MVCRNRQIVGMGGEPGGESQKKNKTIKNRQTETTLTRLK